MDARPTDRVDDKPDEAERLASPRKVFSRPRLVRYPELRRVTMASGFGGTESFF